MKKFALLAIAVGLLSAFPMRAGTIVVWGADNYGQISGAPAGFTNIVAIASGMNHCLALNASGTAVGWGWNYFGQTNVPDFIGGTGFINGFIVNIAAGDWHSLALLRDAQVAAWGNNGNSQCSVPGNLYSVVAISGSTSDSLALTSGGTVAKWGCSGSCYVPGDLTNIVDIADGQNYSLALRADGTIEAWGLDNFGQTDVPPGLSNVVAVAAGNYEPMALTADGRVAVWGGSNTYGQTNVPDGLSNVVAIATGNGQDLALRTDGSVVAWGYYYAGGGGMPVSLSNAVAIAAGGVSMAIQSDGTPQFIYGRQNISMLPKRNFFGGESVLLHASAVGAPPLAYFWKQNGTNVAVTGSPNLTLTNLLATQSGNYTVVASNAQGFAESAPVAFTVDPMVFITNQPAGAVVYEAASPAFSVTAGGVGPFIYQWLFNGTNLIGATNSILTLTQVATNQAGMYSVLVSNPFGSVISSNATLTVQLPTLALQPGDRTAYGGDSTSFTVTASGAAFSYQWQYNGNNLPNATNNVLTLASVDTNSAGVYSALVTNPFRTLATSNATLTVVAITAAISPTNQTLFGGDTATFSAVAQKNGPFTYQWRNNGLDMPGQTNTALVLAGLTTNQSGNYSVFATNPYGQIESSNAGLTVVPVTASVSPASQSLYAGDTATFSASVQKNGPFSYQWRNNGADMPGQTNSTLTLSALTTNRSGNYSVFVVNPYGAIESSTATLTVVDAAPTITSGPASRLTWIGASASFGVSVNGSKPLSYLWSFNGVALPNATNSSLSLSNLKPNQAGIYSVAVSNALGGTTGSATLSLEQVVAWGNNAAGQANYLFMPPLSNAVAVSGGWNFSLALKADGSVYSWGGVTTLPVANSNFVAIAVGSGSQCIGLRSNGTVIAWGDSTVPIVMPASLTNAIAIAVSHSLYSYSINCFAIRSDSTLASWLNNSSNPAYILTNVPAGLMSVVSVAAGNAQAMALKSDGTITAWQNYYDYGANVPPAAISNANNFVAVAAGYSHSLALKTNGTVVAWGSNTYGQTNVPSNLSNVVAIAAGGYHSLALKSDGTAVAWGRNNAGQTTIPTQFTNLVALADGDSHTLALIGTSDPCIARQPQSTTALIGQPLLLSVGAISKQNISYQWQLNGAGIPGATNSWYRVATMGPANRGGYSVTITNVTGAITSSVAQVNMTGNAIVAWGLNASGQTNVPAGLNAVAIGGGDAHSIALRADGTVAAWGTVNNGVTNVPSNVTNIIAVAAGSTHNLAMNSARKVFSWGSLTTPPASFANLSAFAGGYGYSVGVSNGVVAVWNIPSPSPALTNVIALAAGYSQALALRTDGSVATWQGGSSPPAGLSNVVTMAAGNNFYLAARTDGTVAAWGNNNYGQCSVPSNLSNVVAVAAGQDHGLALKSDGTVVGWGWNYYGQTNVPANLGNVIAIAAGGFHSLAMVGSSDPTIIRQPAPVYANVTGRALLSVGAVSSLPLAFQWLTNGAPILGATNWWLDMPHPQTNDGGAYSVIVSNSLGVLVSSNAVVSVLACPPFFLTQPAGQTNCGGGSLTLSASVGGPFPMNYQWQKNGTAISDGTNLNLQFPSLTRSDGGVYALIVSNLFGTATSSNATLRVLIPELLQTAVLGPDGSLTFNFSDSDGGRLSSNDLAHLAVVVSTNLSDWTAATGSLVLTNGALQFLDLTATNYPQRFYQVIELP